MILFYTQSQKKKLPLEPIPEASPIKASGICLALEVQAYFSR